jgi:solute carrier family 35 protein E1
MRIVLAKKELSSDSNTLSAANFFRVITIISAVELLPIAALIEGGTIRRTWDAAISSGVSVNYLISNLLVSGFSYYCYNEVAFWILSSIHPITHAVGNSLKRVVIIIASVVILKAPISSQGMVGSAVAVLGTFLYSLAVQRANATTGRLSEKKGAQIAF